MHLSLIVILCSFCFSISSNDVLKALGSDVKWDFIDIDNDLYCYSYKNKEKNIKLIKIEKEFSNEDLDVFSVIKDIQNYNNITSNESLYSKLVQSKQDTVWGYQLIKNPIPFTRDRQYVFKMYQLEENKLVWTIDDSIVDPMTNSEDAKNLKIGAGSWEIKYRNDKKILINKIYVNDEMNIPGFIIDNLRIRHVAQIFKDVINAAKNKYGDLK